MTILLSAVISIFALVPSLAAATEKPITHPAGKLKIEVSSRKLSILADGKSVATIECQLTAADAPAIRDLIAAKGSPETPITIDLKGIANYCDLRKLQHRCLYDADSGGCSASDLKKVEKGDQDGFDWDEPAKDLEKFLSNSEPPQAPI